MIVPDGSVLGCINIDPPWLLKPYSGRQFLNSLNLLTVFMNCVSLVSLSSASYVSSASKMAALSAYFPMLMWNISFIHFFFIWSFNTVYCGQNSMYCQSCSCFLLYIFYAFSCHVEEMPLAQYNGIETDIFALYFSFLMFLLYSLVSGNFVFLTALFFSSDSSGTLAGYLWISFP